MISFEIPNKKVFDVCGTDGSGAKRINLSTILAIELSKKFTIAKHANRASSGNVGSIDILEQMSYKVAKNPSESQELIDRNNIAFLFAPSFHPEIVKFAEIRKQFKTPTIFNFVMPLLNPVSNLCAQMIGVSNVKMMKLMAKLALKLNKNIIFVHDFDNGLDDVSITGNTLVIEVFDGEMSEYIVKPEDYNLERVKDFSSISGFDNTKDNADLAMQILFNKANNNYLNFLKINTIIASDFFNKCLYEK